MNENEKNENPDIVSMSQEGFECHVHDKLVPGLIKRLTKAAEEGKIKEIRQTQKIRRVPKEEREDGQEHLVTYPVLFIEIEIYTGEQEREKVNPGGMEDMDKSS